MTAPVPDPVLALELFSATLNRLLQLDPEAEQAVARLSGKTIGLSVTGTGLQLFFMPGPRGIDCQTHIDGKADVTIAGPPLALAGLMQGADSRHALFSGDVSITGDIRLGQDFQAVFSRLDIDWEEQLSRLVGDFAARKLSNAARRLFAWGRESATTLTDDLGEYLRIESGLQPAREELDAFLHDVDILRSDVDRIEQRVQRLLQKRAGQRAGGT